MNAFLPLGNGELWQLAGWTMVHFLWLGTLAGLAAMACRLVLRRAPANVRYAVALACFALIAVLPVGIAAWLAAKPQATYVATPDGNGYGPQYVARDGYRELYSATLPQIESAQPAISLSKQVQTAAPTSELLPRASAALESCARFLPWLWLVGTPLTFLLLTTGIVGAERLRRTSRMVGDGPIAEACVRLTATLRIGRRVTVAVCERIAAPVLVGIVRPIILLPPAALTGWSPDEIEMVLLHELAHVRRWDNLINLVQRFIESLLFFHPAVWLVSSWVRREREACCDAVVVGRTNRPHAYAEMLVALAAQMPRSVLFHPAASSAMAAGPLRGRIRRILGLEDDPMLVSGKSLAVVMSGLLLAATLVLLNLPDRSQAEESTTVGSEEKPVRDSDQAASDSGTPSLGDPKFVEVPFAQGATRFRDGDSITIDEVRGTAETFEPGNIYWIKGTYTLGSLDRAALSAFTTAKDAANATGPIWKVQTTIVEGGSGTFTLCLPMSSRGWPHVSFYPVDGGEGFGGTYFGMGDSVLKEWWESNEVVDTTATSATESNETRQSDKDARIVTVAISDHETATAESQPGRLRLQFRRTDGQSGNFPSLEDQKLADLAWKRMGLELEPIGDDDLDRVNTLGYEGGLKITGGAVLDRDLAKQIEREDILVGLHVWPTTSLKDVAEVLNRKDLVELSPLKFYVVRNVVVEAGGFGPSDLEKRADVVVKGRIHADMDLAPTGITPTNAYAPPPIVPASVKYRPPPYPIPGVPLSADSFEPGTITSSSPTGDAIPKNSLLYEEKTFEEWRDIWRHELSTEKRLEAVMALSAFGASGRGKEAAEAIVEVAPQYGLGEWIAVFQPTNSSEVPGRALVRGILDALGASNGGLSPFKIPTKDSVAALAAAAKSGDVQRRRFAVVALARMMNAEAASVLVTLLYDKDPSVRNLALGLYSKLTPSVQPGIDHLKQVIDENKSPETVTLANEALAELERRAGAGFEPEGIHVGPQPNTLKLGSQNSDEE